MASSCRTTEALCSTTEALHGRVTAVVVLGGVSSIFATLIAALSPAAHGRYLTPSTPKYAASPDFSVIFEYFSLSRSSDQL